MPSGSQGSGRFPSMELQREKLRTLKTSLKLGPKITQMASRKKFFEKMLENFSFYLGWDDSITVMSLCHIMCM